MDTRVRLMAAAAAVFSLWLFGCSSPTPAPGPQPAAVPDPASTPEPTHTPEPTASPTATPTPSPTPEPPDVLFRYMRAVQLLDAAQYEEAIPQFDLVIRVIPDLALAYHGRALAHYQREVPSPDLAMKDLDKAIELDPDLADAYRNRGVLRLNGDDREGGIDDLQKALTLYLGEGEAGKAALIRTMLERRRGPSAP